MNIFHSAIIPCFFLPEKAEGHLLNRSIYDSLRTCLSFGSTSQAHSTLINSPSFCQALISSAIGFHRLLLGSHPSDDQTPGILARQFRQLTPWIMGIHVGMNQEFTGSMLADAYGSQAGIEVFQFPVSQDCQDQVEHIVLGGDSSIIKIPNIKVNFKINYGLMPHVADSNDFIAINRWSDSAVFCFSKDKVFKKHYEVKGKILGLKIREESLYIRERTEDQKEKIYKGNLKSSENDLVEVSIPYDLTSLSLKCVFAESHLVLMNEKQLIATPLDSFASWINEEQPNPFDYILPYEQDLIGIVTKTNKFDIVKIKVLENGFQSETVEEICIEGNLVASYLHLGRLFFAFEKYLDSETQIYSYDLETKKLNSLLSSQAQVQESLFEQRFLCSTAGKVHYLCLSLKYLDFGDPSHMMFYLTTFDYTYQTRDLKRKREFALEGTSTLIQDQEENEKRLQNKKRKKESGK